MLEANSEQPKNAYDITQDRHSAWQVHGKPFISAVVLWSDLWLGAMKRRNSMRKVEGGFLVCLFVFVFSLINSGFYCL